MKILHRIFAFILAILAGYCIQLAGARTGIWQIVYYGEAVFWAGFCFAHISKSMEDE